MTGILQGDTIHCQPKKVLELKIKRVYLLGKWQCSNKFLYIYLLIKYLLVAYVDGTRSLFDLPEQQSSYGFHRVREKSFWQLLMPHTRPCLHCKSLSQSPSPIPHLFKLEQQSGSAEDPPLQFFLSGFLFSKVFST